MSAAPAQSPSGRLHGKTIRRLLRRGGSGRISKLLAKIRPEDVALMLRSFTPSERFQIFEILLRDYPEASTTVLLEIDPQMRLGILEQLDAQSIAQLLDIAASDDAVFLLDALPDAQREQVLAIVDLEERFSGVQAQLVYEDDTAGRIMDTDFVALPEETTVAAATERLREVAQNVDMISYLYVIDGGDRLAGVTPLRNLLLARPER
ncbi:MAG: CBS domain-containing protein, partial [Acidobacteriota bacterium]